MVRAVGYLRVSKEEQAAQDRASLPTQEADIRRYCEGKGYDLVEIYCDPGYSGSSRNRPRFRELCQDAEREKFDLIVVWRGDRLARGLRPYVMLQDALDGTEIEIEATNDVVNRRWLAMKAFMAGEELEAIRERCRMGARGRAEKGKVTGNVKYGYVMGEDGKPQVEPHQGEIVKRIFTEYLSGKSALAIARQFNQERIPGPGGGKWWDHRILQIVHDPKYTGKHYWGRRRYTNKDNGQGQDVRKTRYQPEGNWIEVPYPPIIDQVTFDETQERLKHQLRTYAPRDGKVELPREYPLKGILWCGTHGLPYSTKYVKNRQGKVFQYYVCVKGQRYRERSGPCPQVQINSRKIEERLHIYCQDWLLDPQCIEKLRDHYMAQLEQTGNGGLVSMVRNAQERMKTMEGERARLINVYQKGIISETDLDLRVRMLDEEREYHQETLKRAEREVGGVTAALVMLDQFAKQAPPDEAPLAAALARDLKDGEFNDPAMVYQNTVLHYDPGELIRKVIKRVTVTGDPHPDDLAVTLNVTELVLIQPPQRWLMDYHQLTLPTLELTLLVP